MHTGSSTDRIKLLFLAGAGRCGSTLLESLLAQQEGVFAAGEVTHLWVRSILMRGRCSCGREFRHCTTWNEIFADAFGGMSEQLATQMASAELRMRSRYVPMLASRALRTRYLRTLGSYPERLEQLYRSIHSLTQARTIVDGSLVSTHGYLLAEMQSIDLYVVHLIRDPRACAFSWSQLKPELGYADARARETFQPLQSTASWILLNESAGWLRRTGPARYIRLRYEDFVSSPAQTVEAIGHLLGANFDSSAVDGTTLSLGPTHSSWGNASRFKSGDVQLRLDDEWRKRMRRRDRALVAAMTWPWMVRYGYCPKLPSPLG